MKYFYILKENKWLTLILILAAILRFYHLNFQSLWLDEIYTMNVSNPNNTFSVFLDEVKTKGGFPYIYFILLKILFSIFGYYSIIARLFSAIFGVLAVYGMYLFGKEIFNKKVGLYAALLLSVSEYCIYISQDARPYTFYLFGVIVSFLAISKFIKIPSLKNALIYGLLSGLLLNTNFFGFVNMFTQVVIILFYLIIYPKENKIEFLKRSLIAGAIAIVLFLPNIVLFSNLFGFKSNWIPAPTNESFTLLFKDFLGNSEITLFIFSPLFAYYLICLFKEKETVNFKEIIENKLVFSFIILLPWLFVFCIVLLIKSFSETSVMVSRYFTSILPVFFIIIGVAIYLIKNKIIRYTVLICLVLCMWINTDIVKKYYDVPNKTQFRETADFVISNNKNNEQVFTSLSYFYNYFFTMRNVKYTLVEKPNLEAVINEMIQDPSKIKPFWYLDAHGRPFVLSEIAQKFVNDNFYIENNFDGLDAWSKHFILLKDVPNTINLSKFKDIKQSNGDSFNSSLEAFEYSNNILKISGWAYFPNQEAKKTTIDLVLIKNGIATRIQKQIVNRPDVTSYFKSEFDISNSGFSCVFDTSKLESGQYQIAIYLSNKETKKEGLTLTDKFITK